MTAVAVTRRAAYERWEKASESLRRERRILEQQLTAVAPDADSTSSSVVRTATELLRCVSASTTLRERSSAFSRLFKVVPRDDGRAGPRIIQHLEMFEATVKRFVGALATQQESVECLGRVLSEIRRAAAGLPTSEVSQLTRTARDAPRIAQRLLSLAVVRHQRTTAAVSVSVNALYSGIVTGLLRADALEASEPAYAERLGVELRALHDRADGLTKVPLGDQWAKLSHGHGELGASLAVARRLSFDVVRERVDSASTAWVQVESHFVRPAEELEIPLARLKQIRDGISNACAKGDRGVFTVTDVSNATVAWNAIAEQLRQACDLPGALVPKRSSAAEIVRHVTGLLEQRVASKFAVQEPSLPGIGARPSLEALSRRWAALGPDIGSRQAAEVVSALIALRRAASASTQMPRARALVCCEQVLKLARLWSLGEMPEVEDIRRQLLAI